MSCTNLTRHRIASLAAFVVAAGCGTSVGAQLTGYGVPLPLYMACGAAAGATVARSLGDLVDRLATTVYRCREADCTYKVRVTDVDAVEQRRWQEAAASHPGHELNYRP